MNERSPHLCFKWCATGTTHDFITYKGYNKHSKLFPSMSDAAKH